MSVCSVLDSALALLFSIRGVNLTLALVPPEPRTTSPDPETPAADRFSSPTSVVTTSILTFFSGTLTFDSAWLILAWSLEEP
jgi:hypothetical protein